MPGPCPAAHSHVAVHNPPSPHCPSPPADFKDGVPRTAYNGVVTFRQGSTVVHLVPGPGVKLYEYADD